MKRNESETVEFLSKDRTRLVAEISKLRDALRKIIRTEQSNLVEYIHHDVVTIAEEAPQEIKDGCPVEASGFDIEDLELIENGVVRPKPEEQRTNGPMPNVSRISNSR